MKRILKPFVFALMAAMLISCNDDESTVVWHYPGDCLLVFPDQYKKLDNLEKNRMQRMEYPLTDPDRIGAGFWTGASWLRSTGSLDDTLSKLTFYQYREYSSESKPTTKSYKRFVVDNNVEVRAGNGWSNLGDLFSIGTEYGSSIKYTSVTKVEPSEFNSSNDNSDHTYTDYYITKSMLTSPPAYLHLTLDSIFDIRVSPGFAVAPLKFKEWQVDKIMSNGADVTNAAGWSCYADNLYTFRKNGSVKYEPGLVSCDIDQTLADNDLQSIFLNFTLEPEFLDFDNPGKISLSFDIPTLKPGVQLDPEDFTFEILSSDFQSAVFKITNGSGESAELHLVPTS
jgi:hypothetical protein